MAVRAVRAWMRSRRSGFFDASYAADGIVLGVFYGTKGYIKVSRGEEIELSLGKRPYQGRSRLGFRLLNNVSVGGAGAFPAGGSGEFGCVVSAESTPDVF